MNTLSKRLTLSFIGIIVSMVLAGCRSNDLFGEDLENITSIEIRDSDTEEIVTVITDSSIIDPLVDELEHADSSSTANLDIMLPEYRLLFLDSEENVIQDIGYYREEKEFGVVGRYLTSDRLLAVTTELPIEENE